MSGFILVLFFSLMVYRLSKIDGKLGKVYELLDINTIRETTGSADQVSNTDY